MGPRDHFDGDEPLGVDGVFNGVGGGFEVGEDAGEGEPAFAAHANGACSSLCRATQHFPQRVT